MTMIRILFFTLTFVYYSVAIQCPSYFAPSCDMFIKEDICVSAFVWNFHYGGWFCQWLDGSCRNTTNGCDIPECDPKAIWAPKCQGASKETCPKCLLEAIYTQNPPFLLLNACDWVPEDFCNNSNTNVTFCFRNSRPKKFL